LKDKKAENKNHKERLNESEKVLIKEKAELEVA